MSSGESCQELDRLKISWSQLQTHFECKQRAMLQRRGFRSPLQDVRNFFHGTVVDLVMRNWLESDNPVSGQMEGMVEDHIALCLDKIKTSGDGVVKWKSATDRAELTGFCKSLVVKLEPVLQQLVLPYDYQPELRFKVTIRIPYLDGTLAEVDLVGGIDIAVRRSRNPPRWFAYDLKATANPDYVRKILGQGIFYDLAMLAMFGQSPEEFGFIQPMVEDNPLATIKVSNDDRVSMLARITQVAHDRWRGDNQPKTSSEGCSYCPVKSACVKFSPRSTGVFVPKRGRSPLRPVG